MGGRPAIAQRAVKHTSERIGGGCGERADHLLVGTPNPDVGIEDAVIFEVCGRRPLIQLPPPPPRQQPAVTLTLHLNKFCARGAQLQFVVVQCGGGAGVRAGPTPPTRRVKSKLRVRLPFTNCREEMDALAGASRRTVVAAELMMANAQTSAETPIEGEWRKHMVGDGASLMEV